MYGLFMTQSLNKERKLEEDKTDEYYRFESSENSEDDGIINVVVGHAVSVFASKMTSKLRKQKGKGKVCHSESWEQGSQQTFLVFQDVLKTSSRRLGRQKNVTLKTSSVRLHQDDCLLGFIHWNDKEFKQCMRISRQIFNYIHTEIGEYLEKTPTKKRYRVSNMGLVSYNKRFLHTAVGAPGSTHDSRLLKKHKDISTTLKR